MVFINYFHSHLFQDSRSGIQKLPVISSGKALKIKALVDFDDNGTLRTAGSEWQIEGPCTYYPRPECRIVHNVDPVIITHLTALHLKAKVDLVDKNGIERVTGFLFATFFYFIYFWLSFEMDNIH